MRSMKIDRRCPHCHKRLYHFVNLRTKRVHCSDCGHDWTTRWNDVEREDVTAAITEEKRREAL